MAAASPVFSVLVLTAPPPTQASEAGGAYVKIDGRESLLRSVEMFLNRENVKQIHIIVDLEDAEEAKRKYGTHLGLMGAKLIAGGPRWQDQLAAAMDKFDAECTLVIVHYGARPAVTFSDVDAVMEGAEKNPFVMHVSPLRNQLVAVVEGGNPVAYHLPTH